MTSPPELRVFGGGVDTDEERIAFRTGSHTWQRGVRVQARNLSREIDTSYMKLARLLWEIFDTPADDKNGPPVYTRWDYKTFTAYVEGDLGIPGRKGEHLKNIWYKLAVENGGMALSKNLEDRLVKLGWSKVRELVSVLTPQNAQTWIEAAEQKNFHELTITVVKAREELRAAAARAESIGEDPSAAKLEAKDTIMPASVRIVARRFDFYDDQWENVSLALEKARTIASASKDRPNEGYLLDLICTEFLGTNNFGEQSTSAKVAMLHKMSNLMGLKLAIIDPSAPIGEKIVYGLQHLEDLQKITDQAVEDEEGEAE